MGEPGSPRAPPGSRKAVCGWFLGGSKPQTRGRTQSLVRQDSGSQTSATLLSPSQTPRGAMGGHQIPSPF